MHYCNVSHKSLSFLPSDQVVVPFLILFVIVLGRKTLFGLAIKVVGCKSSEMNCTKRRQIPYSNSMRGRRRGGPTNKMRSITLVAQAWRR